MNSRTIWTRMRRVLAAAFVAVMLHGGEASAHAFLKSASPAVGSAVQAVPMAVTIDYTEGVEPKFSTITVQDAAGARVDTGDVQAAPGNAKRLTVGLKPLKPGTYKVTWHVTSTDTHKTEGAFSFTVNP